MLSIYLVCAIIGGILVVLSAVGGLDGFDAEGLDPDGFDVGDFELDTGIDVLEINSPEINAPGTNGLETDIEVVDGGKAADERSPRRSPPRISILRLLLSLKFWSFGSCFFGLTGLVFTVLQPNLTPWIVLVLAIAMGLICGGGMAGILQALRQRRVDSLVRSNDLVGLLGTVELPFDAQSRGKVRMQVKGSMVDFVAHTDAAGGFAAGDRVVVVGTEQNRVWVVSEDSIRTPMDRTVD